MIKLITQVFGGTQFNNCPPFTFERRLLATLSSWIVAPLPVRCLMTFTFSSREILSPGWHKSAEPPPDIRLISIKGFFHFFVEPRAERTSAVASTEASLGKLFCAAEKIRMSGEEWGKNIRNGQLSADSPGCITRRSFILFLRRLKMVAWQA